MADAARSSISKHTDFSLLGGSDVNDVVPVYPAGIETVAQGDGCRLEQVGANLGIDLLLVSRQINRAHVLTPSVYQNFTKACFLLASTRLRGTHTNNETIPMVEKFKLHAPLLLWWIIAASTAFHVLIYFDSDYTIDDSWITFRYAENLVAGHGLVYNLGERVQGSTSPLEIFLIAGFLLVGLKAKTAAIVISLAANAGFLFCAHRLVDVLCGRARSPLFILPLAVAPSLIKLSVSGMETMLFLFLQVAVFVAYVEGKSWLLGLFAALLVLTRIDGALVIFAIILTDLVLRIRSLRSDQVGSANRPADLPWPCVHSGKAAGLMLVLVAPWFAFATWYYGNPIPNSVWAKRVLYGEVGFDRTPLPSLFEAIARMGFFLPWQVGACIAISGLVFLAARLDRFSSIAIWFAAYLTFLIAGKAHVHPWYLAPFYAFSLVAACLLVSRLFTTLSRWAKDGLSGAAVSMGVWIFLILLSAWGVFGGRLSAAVSQEKHETAHVAVARYLKQNAKADEVIYAPDIGYIGTITGRKILDAVGIVSPEVIPFNRSGDFAGVLRLLRPDWAVIGLYGSWQKSLLMDPWVRTNYYPVYANNPDRSVDWPLPHELEILKYDWDYLVLRLTQTAD
jgi:hypothetical protein